MFLPTLVPFFLALTPEAAALTRVMRAAVPIPDVAASVLHSAAVGGSVIGDVGSL